MFRANGYILKDLLGHDSDESRVHSLQRFSTLLRNIHRYNVPPKFLCSHTGFEPAMDIIIVFIITVIVPREKPTLTEGKVHLRGGKSTFARRKSTKGGGGGLVRLDYGSPRHHGRLGCHHYHHHNKAMRKKISLET